MNDRGQSDPAQSEPLLQRGHGPDGDFRAVSVDFNHTCGLHNDGAIECWGYDEYGKATPPMGSFTAVSAGFYYTCGLRDNGTIECWGINEEDDLYDGETDPPTD